MRTRWLALFFVLAARLAGAAEDSVKVEKADVKVEYKTFDPKNLPEPPPPLKGKEAAVCVYRFGVDSSVQYGYRQPRDPAAGTTVELGKVTVRLALSVTVWLPDNATPQLKAHEEGHRTIAEHYYTGADAIARERAKKVVGRKIPVRGNDIEAAAKAAIEKVNKELCDGTMAAIEGPCGKAQDIFDEMTDHGRKAKPTSEEGVKVAVERAGKEK